MSWQMSLMQNPATMTAMLLSSTHNLIMEIMIMISITIMSVLIIMFMNKLINRMMMQNNVMEISWTILPMIIIVYMASPSLQVLYMMEEIQNPSMSTKIMGHQWYWTYEYPDFKKSMDSYMSMNTKTKFRLLETDNRLIMPLNLNNRILCSSADVIHSWTVPSMGLKMDATPGRMNQMLVNPFMAGVYYGQCSEICGMNHSFMPIVTEVVSPKMFTSWIKSL